MSDDGIMDAEPRQGMFSKIGSFLSRSSTTSLPNNNQNNANATNSETKPLVSNPDEPMTYEKLLEVLLINHIRFGITLLFVFEKTFLIYFSLKKNSNCLLT